MLWFLLGILIVILGAFILFGVLQLLFGIIGWIIQLIMSIFGMDD